MSRWPDLSGRIALALTSVAALAAIAGSGTVAAQQSPVAAGAPAQRVVWLDQNWDDGERAAYHHASQGTATIPVPYSWFMALEQPDSRGMFSDPAYLDQFGFIPSSRSAENPDALPIGFAATPSPGDPKAVLGFTCAACHTGRIDYGGTNLLIDGGPALTNLGAFRNALAKAVAKAADLRNGNFDRFAKRLYPDEKPLSPVRRALWKQLTGGLIKGLIAKLELDGRGKGTVEEGFGRLDALNRIGNEVFANQMERPDNLRALTAPVAYPHIWDTSWFDWVQYNSSIEQPMVRNAGEAMGVGAKVNWDPAKPPLFSSSVPPDRLYAIESRLAGRKQPQEENKFTGLRSPQWPDRILPPVDPTLAAQGAELYKDMKCSSCHLPGPDTEAFWKGPHWTRAEDNAGRERYLALKVIPVSVIGTDEAQAADMKARTVSVASAVGLPDRLRTSGRDGIYAFGPALGAAVERVVNRWYDDHGTSADDRARMNGFRPNGIRDGLRRPDGSTVIAYKARPLNGIWATAPFLHNGSVPTLWALLSPYDERPKTFWLGNREFDPVNVGYRTDPVPGGFQLVAAKVDSRNNVTPVRGNWNGGHLFDVATPRNRGAGIIGRPLTQAERRALIEYLKSL